MNRIITYTIEKADSGQTILEYLKAHDYTSAGITELKRMHESIMKNGVWSYVSDVLQDGDELKICIDEQVESEQIEAKDIPIKIVYEDEDMVVIDKPDHMPIHPSINNHDNTLANALMYYYHSKGEKLIYRCINRLDRDTTGLTIIAKHIISAGMLYDMMRNRQIRRTYIAVVHDTGDMSEAGTVDAPIGRLEDSCISRGIDKEHGEQAVTHYKVLKRVPEKDASVVELILDTGRTHQIRVHMNSIGHPLIGDYMYNEAYKDTYGRPLLHAYKLDYRQPISGEDIHLVAEIPDDMKNYLLMI